MKVSTCQWPVSTSEGEVKVVEGNVSLGEKRAWAEIYDLNLEESETPAIKE